MPYRFVTCPYHIYIFEDYVFLAWDLFLSGELTDLRKRGHMFDFWYGITFGPSELNWQAQRVVTLRMNKFATEGIGASSEAHQMINEKVSAFSEAAMKLATGTFPHIVMEDLRSIVDENVKRLSA
jgi:hypothetical protein